MGGEWEVNLSLFPARNHYQEYVPRLATEFLPSHPHFSLGVEVPNRVRPSRLRCSCTPGLQAAYRWCWVVLPSKAVPWHAVRLAGGGDLINSLLAPLELHRSLRNCTLLKARVNEWAMKQSKEKQTQSSKTSHRHVQHSKKVQMWFLKQSLIFIWFWLVQVTQEDNPTKATRTSHTGTRAAPEFTFCPALARTVRNLFPSIKIQWMQILKSNLTSKPEITSAFLQSALRMEDDALV